ncbi:MULTISPECIES: response regulator [Pseudomonas]|jgi:DNA-binding NtrC family response regulator|uniref:Response regulator n=2 Tax=Pseudomonas TaxID=286 RepID=A0ABS0MYA2_PSELU|nr:MULTISPECIES: response regulator [Pseudomonas]AYN96503.1 response regulator [Pseudomonas sp. LTJR-52]MBA1246074.1 response regulator [Pseudomonas zeshuii]MBF8643781.1 response regulator [Pseudomonas zeshuii]MBH3441692.1 response regulator [Pseudomonas luteola]MDN3235484.1 response regulator [Pseudomonas sp. WAC2]
MYSQQSTQGTNRTPSTVLVVEDEEVIREFVRELLDGEGFNVMTAESADVAHALLQDKAADIDLLITDIRMPGSMDGAQLANHVGATWPHIPIIVMSGYDTPATASIKYKVRFLPKPWSIGQLIDMVTGVAYSATPST